MTFKRGDCVEYTPAAIRALAPPGEGTGTVEEVGSVGVLVRWPFGLAEEFPRHIQHVSAVCS